MAMVVHCKLWCRLGIVGNVLQAGCGLFSLKEISLSLNMYNREHKDCPVFKNVIISMPAHVFLELVLVRN